MNNNHCANYRLWLFCTRSVYGKVPLQALLIMKLTLLLTCALSFQSLAEALAQKVDIQVKNQSLKSVIQQLQRQSGYSFVLDEVYLAVAKPVTLSLKDTEILDALPHVFADQPFDYQVAGKVVFFSPKKGMALTDKKGDIRQQRTVSGRVTDEGGKPLEGVTVTAKGTSVRVTTDVNGEYRIDVPFQQGELLFTIVGFETAERALGNSAVIDISMKASVSDLEEVIVVGYGTVKKSDLTGAVSSIKADELAVASAPSLMQLIAGKAAGVTAQQTSAQPGGGVEILVRGAGSTGAGNTPLYIIDGFPVGGGSVEPASDNRYSDFGNRNPLNSINVNDIESIEVLKDASSTAIYGARAANGVILITTKKGKQGDAVVNYNGSGGVQQIANKVEMMSGADFMEEANRFSREKWLFDNRIAPYGNMDPASVTPWRPLYEESQIASVGAGTDWYDEIVKRGQIGQHDVSFSGGTDRSKYMVSFNYFDQTGVVKNSDFSRYSGRINLEHKIKDRIVFGLNMTRSYIKNTNTPLGTEDWENSGLINAAMVYDPTISIRDNAGNYLISPQMSMVPNPVSLLEIDDHTQSNRTLLSSFVQAELVNGLMAKVNLGFDDQSAMRNAYLPKTTLYGAQEGGKASKNQVSRFDKLMETTLNYQGSLFRESRFSHQLNALLGYSFQEFNSDGVAASNSQFFTDAFKYNSLATGEARRPTVSSFKGKEVIQSFFGRVNYNLDDRYLLTVTVRMDGSNKFGKNNRYGIFPSGAVAWRISQENFMRPVEVISDLKLRLSYGQTGNSNIGNNAYEYYSAAWREYVFGDQVNIGSYKQQLANPDLKWETTTELNLGMDFGFFNQRISGSIEYFSKVISDLLGYRTLKSFMEVSTVAANIGKTSSTGAELTLHTRNTTGAFKWNSEFNFTRYVDRWKERNPDVQLSPWQKNNDYIRSQYGYVSDGLLGIGEAPPAHMPSLLPGQIKVKDINGYLRDETGAVIPDANGKVQYTNGPDGMLDEADIRFLGTFDPGFSIGFGNTFQYKRFDLNVFFYGMFNRIVINETRGKFSVPEIRRILNGHNLTYEVRERWASDNPDGQLPSGFVSVYPQPADYLWEDGTFLRCRTINLGYTLPVFGSGKVYSKARIYADISNPFVITSYKGNDPETDFKAGYPNQRSFILGCNISF